MKNKRHIVLSLLLFLSAWFALPFYAQRISFEGELPPYPKAEGVAAPFAGFIDKYMLVGGGTNFPDIPASEGGYKVFHNDFYLIDTEAKAPAWKKAFQLDYPIAHGATVSHGGNLICIGGMNADSLITSVFTVQVDPKTGKPYVFMLPNLPEGVAEGAATIYNDEIYLCGGRTSSNENVLYRLNLLFPTAWERLANYPGSRRIQPLLFPAEDGVILMGGFDKDATTNTCLLPTNMLKYYPEYNVWAETGAIPADPYGASRCMVGATGLYKDGQIIVAGGVNRNVFKAAVEGKAGAGYLNRPIPWYQFNSDILNYSLEKRNWVVLPRIAQTNRAGGILLERNSKLYMVMGELKPGIRTPQISIYQTTSLFPQR